MDRIKGLSRLTPHPILILIASCILALPCIAASQERPSPDGPYIIGNGVKAPVVLSQPLPAYTEAARASRIEGIVLIQAVIRKDGTVDNFKVLRGLGYGLDESAIKTIAEKWRFQPGTYNGVPVDVQANIEVSFRLYHRPEDGEMLRAFPLRAVIIDAKWNEDSSGKTIGSGYGNLLGGGLPRGFRYTTSCVPGFNRLGTLLARWIEPESRLEILTAFEPATKVMKSCEFKVTMQSAIFTLKDGQAIAVDPPTPNQR